MSPRATTGDASLAPYRAKRNFARTREPIGGAAAGAARSFVVQHHLARRDHFDFRLEVDGTLKSWAVTKGPSGNPATKRLAVRVEDHPVDYASFEGQIPKGEYGGGSVQLWDRGTFEIVGGDPLGSIDKGALKVRLNGERMKGGWALVRMKPRGGEKRENWLLIKERDEFAEGDDSLAERYDSSVDSGRTLDQITAGVGGVKQWSSRKPAAKSKSAAMPFIPPMLCTLQDAPPTGDDWLHEMKYDGYRLQAIMNGDGVRLHTRTGLDWTEKFAGVQRAFERLGLDRTIIDGEAVVFDKAGVSDFGGLVETLKKGSGSIHFAAFDIMFHDGKDLRAKPLVERKALLQKLVEDKETAIMFAPHVIADGAEIFRAAINGGSEGIVSKRIDSTYRSGRASAWIKVKGRRRDDVTIVGWTPSERGRSFASLVVAYEANGKLTYAGRVGTGFDAAKSAMLMAAMAPLAQDKPGKIAGVENAPRGVKWIKPKLVAEIEKAGVTRDGMVRQGAFIALREDLIVDDDEITRSFKGAPSTDETNTQLAELPSSVRLTHPEKLLYPKAGVSKKQLAQYLYAVAPRMLPHLANRPVSLVRAPSGVDGQKFFQRHPLKGMSKGITEVKVRAEKNAYLAIESIDGLMTCAQFDALELHGWCALASDIEHPDRIVFDLDPDEKLSFADVRDAAEEIRDLLAAANLRSFALISGGKGVHIVAPLSKANTWEEIEAFTKGVAMRLAADRPERYIAVMTKARRTGKIFIDYLRNKKTASAIVPWSPRARPEASVAVPVSWEKLRTLGAANTFNMQTALQEPADPWAGFFKLRQRIAKKTLDLFR